MEYALSELLTREELLSILRERKLEVPNMEQLPQEELMRLYKSFALPLPRRENVHGSSSSRRLRSEHIMPAALQTEGMNMDIVGDGGHLTGMEVDMLYANDLQSLPTTEPTKLHSESAIPLTVVAATAVRHRKRLHNYNQLKPYADDYLCNATKRIKIAWS